ncbi:MAG: hypothetical protein KDH96_03575 [Candidatus Riesia sp.]|nr:hypothetical protein [Candidatus Riesia sp.]
MKEAYLTTIRDLEIDLRHTQWWRFRRIAYLQRQIEYYEKLLKKQI